MTHAVRDTNNVICHKLKQDTKLGAIVPCCCRVVCSLYQTKALGLIAFDILGVVATRWVLQQHIGCCSASLLSEKRALQCLVVCIVLGSVVVLLVVCASKKDAIRYTGLLFVGLVTS